MRSGSVVTDVGTEYSYEMPGFFSSPNRRTCQKKSHDPPNPPTRDVLVYDELDPYDKREL